MAEVGKTLREAWIKGMESISAAANGLASNTRYKVEEMNLQSRRKELLNGFGQTAYGLWKQGEAFPEEAEKILREIGEVDQALEALEAERQERAKAAEAASEQPAEEPAEESAEEPAAEEPTAAESAETEAVEAEPVEVEPVEVEYTAADAAPDEAPTPDEEADIPAKEE